MKKLVYSLLSGLAVLGLARPAAQAQQMPAQRQCATMEVLAAQLAADPSYGARLQAIDQQASVYAKQKAANPTQRTSSDIIVTIPVVVHVLYNTTAQNISDAQVQSQIDVLNADFHRKNADLSKVPAAFTSLIGDAGVQFVLAKRDPNGNATTGIVHKSTTATSFDSSDKMKFSSSGGDDAWPAASYLNLWSCNLGGGLLGYAQFPGGAAATDGVAILYSAFGNGGSAVAPYNLGRTATHEVGHWLNLRHIWGDARCGNDQVGDTPTQQTSNYGCPTFPHVTCSNGASGDMFMNYMDYTDDGCMQMFSSGQGDRMDALFATGGSRASLLSSQGGLAPGTSPTPTPTPTTPTYCASQGTAASQYIDYVKLGSISRTSGNDGGYYNGTALSTSVATGSSQTISFSAGFANKASTVYFDVYADWNQDGSFDDAGETLVAAAGSSSKTTRSATFAVPATAMAGTTRLRVVMSTSSATTSCGTYSAGETEDYTLTVTGGATARLGTPSDHYTIYPNPATDMLTIERPASADASLPLRVHVYDLRGAEVADLPLTNDQLRVSTLRQGVYLLTVSDGTTTSHQRFVKQ
ncbi:GEVED domain-containing protein [Hymenobacter setariae]|uniref:GEVED domain-containing protein n=1 Tax=Hymenobacter setariae TaxID=2594794 RepID=UPI001F1E8924|nr:GEVED domain-containing protein [Hymenobacter setariae]